MNMTARYSNYHSHSPLMISPLFPTRKLKGRYQQSHNTNYTQNNQRGCHSNCFGVTILFMVMRSPQKSNRSNNCPHFPNSTRNARHVVLNLVGKSSAGKIKVVVFRPKLEKKNVSPYRIMNPIFVLSSQYM